MLMPAWQRWIVTIAAAKLVAALVAYVLPALRDVPSANPIPASIFALLIVCFGGVAVFLFVAPSEATSVAARFNATPFDIDGAFWSYCPHCCLADLGEQQTPYGRRVWLQSWCTLCEYHGTALVLRNCHHRRVGPEWSAQTLRAETHYLAPDRYGTLKVVRESNLRCLILGSLVEIERAISNALAGLSPNPLSWGMLTPTEFLRIVNDLTTWSLTHFEPVRAWSLAEDLSAAEEQEGYGLIGRRRRMSTADYPPHRSLRTLREVTVPKIRGSALWVAHALMSASHVGASDRDANSSLQERQASYLTRDHILAVLAYAAERERRYASYTAA